VPQRAIGRDDGKDMTARRQRLYLEQLFGVRAAEQQAYGAFPRMAEIAGDEDVTAVLRSAASETEIQLARLNALLEGVDPPFDEPSPSPVELLHDAREVLNGKSETMEARDALLLRSARRSLRHQISGYESACASARRLGDFRTLDILLLSLDEELATDSALSEIVSHRSRLLRAI